MKNIAVGYFRVSTQKQSIQGHALERYDEELINYGVAADDLYSDVESGGSFMRAGFNQLCDRIETDSTVKTLVVPSHSRLHRDLLIWATLRELLIRKGVDLIDLYRGRSPIDLLSIATTVDAALSEEQRLLNKRYALDGHRHRRSRGKSCTVPFGYTLNKEGVCVPNYEMYGSYGLTCWQVARMIVEKYLECRSLARTVTWANQLWPECTAKSDHPSSGSGLRTWLKNQTLRGHLVYFGWRDYLPTNTEPKEHQTKQIVYNHHKALISAEEAATIETALEYPSAPRGKSHRLARLVCCAECDRPLARIPLPARPGKSKAYVYLKCLNAYPKYGKPKTCSNRVPHRYEKIEKQVIEALMQNAELVAERRNQDLESEEDPQVLQLETEIKTLENITGADLLIEEKRRAIAALKNSESDRPSMPPAKILKLQEAAGNPLFWEECTDDDRATIYRTLLESVAVGSDSVAAVSFKRF